MSFSESDFTAYRAIEDQSLAERVYTHQPYESLSSARAYTNFNTSGTVDPGRTC